MVAREGTTVAHRGAVVACEGVEVACEGRRSNQVVVHGGARRSKVVRWRSEE